MENGDLVRWFTHLTWWFSIHNSGRSPRFSWLNQLVRLGDFQVRKLLVYQRVSPTQRSRFVCQLTNKVYDRYIISMAFYGVVNQLITRAHHLFLSQWPTANVLTLKYWVLGGSSMIHEVPVTGGRLCHVQVSHTCGCKPTTMVTLALTVLLPVLNVERSFISWLRCEPFYFFIFVP